MLSALPVWITVATFNKCSSSDRDLLVIMLGLTKAVKAKTLSILKSVKSKLEFGFIDNRILILTICTMY